MARNGGKSGTEVRDGTEVGDGTEADDERWAQAEAVLDRVDNPGAQRRQRTRRNQAVLLVVGFLLLTAMAIVLGGIFLGGASESRQADQVSTWKNVLSVIFTICGVVSVCFGWVLLIRSGTWGSRWRAPSAVLTRRQRKGNQSGVPLTCGDAGRKSSRWTPSVL